jgi:hypothetical protein
MKDSGDKMKDLGRYYEGFGERRRLSSIDRETPPMKYEKSGRWRAHPTMKDLGKPERPSPARGDRIAAENKQQRGGEADGRTGGVPTMKDLGKRPLPRDRL